MPVVIIHGVPSNTPKEKLEKLIPDLQIMVGSAKGMNNIDKQVSVFFQPDMVEEGLGEEIIVFINGLYKKPERTESVLKDITERVGNRIKNYYFPEALVEVFIQIVEPSLCWSSSK